MLAEAARTKSGADFAIGETGVAGPGPNGRGIAAGTTSVAVVGPGGLARSRTIQSEAGVAARAANMTFFAAAALELAVDVLLDLKSQE